MLPTKPNVRPMTVLTWGILLLAPLILAACSGGATLPHHYVYEGYRPIYLNYAAGRGGMPTEVVGNPFETPKPQFDAQVAEILENHHFGPELPFLTETPEGFSSVYHVVVVFDPPIGTAPSRICADPNVQAAPRPGEVGVLAAFCQNDRRITSAGGHVAGAENPDDPRFQALMRQVATLLFPPRSPDINDPNVIRVN